MSPPLLPHLDDVAGAVAGLAQRLGPRAHDTIPALALYEGLDLATLFPSPPAIPADVRVRQRWTLAGVESEDLSFRSLHEPLDPEFRRRYGRDYPEIHTVWARRVRPAGSGESPRLLYLHGYMQPETYIEELTLLTSLAMRLDVKVIQMQPPYHGRRAPGASRFSGEFYWTADLVRSVEALRQTLLPSRATR